MPRHNCSGSVSVKGIEVSGGKEAADVVGGTSPLAIRAVRISVWRG